MENNLTVDPVPVPNQPIHRKPNYLLLFLILILIIITAILSYFVRTLKVQVDNLKQLTVPVREIVQTPANFSVPSATQSSGPIVTQDETDNWKTFINKEYGYSFKYPLGLKAEGQGMGATDDNPGYEVWVFSTKDREASKTYLEHPFFIVDVTNASTNLEALAKSSFAGNKINNLLASKLEEFSNNHVSGWQYDFSGNAFDTPNPEGLTDGLSGFVINYKEKMRVVFLQNDKRIYRIVLSNTSPFNQILSTFKFL